MNNDNIYIYIYTHIYISCPIKIESFFLKTCKTITCKNRLKY